MSITMRPCLINSVQKSIIIYAALIFLVAAISKLSALATPGQIWALPNPVFHFVSNRTVFAGAGILEFMVVVFSLGIARRSPQWALAGIIWFATILIIYRMALASMGAVSDTCNCLGALGRLLYPEDQGASLAHALLWSVFGLSSTGWLLPYVVSSSLDDAARLSEINPHGKCAVKENGAKSHCRLAIIATIFTAVQFLEAAQTLEAGFSVRGTISQQLSGKAGADSASASPDVHFSVSVVGPTWDLTLDHNYGTHRYHSDGTNVFELFYDAKATNTIVPGVVHHDGFPSNGHFDGVLWFAYASGGHIKTQSPMPAPWIPARSDPRAFMFDVSLEKLGDQPRIPFEAEFIGNRKRFDLARKSSALKIEAVTPAAAKQRKLLTLMVRDKFREASYRVLETTNIGEVSIPVQFELTLYRPTSIRVTNPVVAKYIGQAVEIKTISDRPTLPIPNERGVAVTDRRFRSNRQLIDCIQYRITNSWILATSDPRLTDIFRAKKQAAPFIRLSSPQELLYWSLFALLAILPAAALWWQSRQRKNKKTKQPMEDNTCKQKPS
jgi:hypothetical protein